MAREYVLITTSSSEHPGAY